MSDMNELMRRLGPTCDVCGKTLEAVFPERCPIDGCGELPEDHRHPPKYLQYDNALHVRFDGGYGEFVDNYEGGDRYYSIICHECAHDLCERVPWIKDVLRPERSHTHREW
jgi:hypothetical protein